MKRAISVISIYKWHIASIVFFLTLNSTATQYFDSLEEGPSALVIVAFYSMNTLLALLVICNVAERIRKFKDKFISVLCVLVAISLIASTDFESAFGWRGFSLSSIIITTFILSWFSTESTKIKFFKNKKVATFKLVLFTILAFILNFCWYGVLLFLVNSMQFSHTSYVYNMLPTLALTIGMAAKFKISIKDGSAAFRLGSVCGLVNGLSFFCVMLIVHKIYNLQSDSGYYGSLTGLSFLGVVVVYLSVSLVTVFVFTLLDWAIKRFGKANV